jgi:hypothetical protein
MRLAFLTTACVIAVMALGRLIDGQSLGAQRAPCANFNGAGRIPYCGGKPAVYAIIDVVAFEPSRDAAKSIRISGTFIVPVPVSSGLHMAPQRGFLYLSLVPEREPAIRTDWADLAAAAGTGEVVGFGEYWVSQPDPNHPSGTVNTSLVVNVHKNGDEAEPEPYPLPHERGVIKTFDRPADLNPRFGQPSAMLVTQLKEAARR